MQDGIDLINAVAAHPATGPRLARKLYALFRQRGRMPPDEELIADLRARSTTQNDYEIKPMLMRLFTVAAVRAIRSNCFTRYSWPAEFVARALQGDRVDAAFRSNDALTPLITMGQQLFEPPDVAGWDLGQRWFSSGAMLGAHELRRAARRRIRSSSCATRRADRVRVGRSAAVVGARSARRAARSTGDPYNALVDYVRAGGAWTGIGRAAADQGVGPGAPDRRDRASISSV